MVLLLGGSGYVGSVFASELSRRAISFSAPRSNEADLSSPQEVRNLLEAVKPTFLINAVGYTGRPNIDSTEREKARCLLANTTVPATLAEALAGTSIRWGHVSSGCIYDGNRPDGTPFTEEDAPNFAFENPTASWYSRTKAMAETLLKDYPNALIWRLRIPFDQFDHDRNYLTKVMRYDRLLEVTNSISQLGEFARVAVDTLLRGLPGGLYNVTNRGTVRTSEVAEAVRRHGLCDKQFRFFKDETEFLADPGRVRRASCALSSEKLAGLGLPLREVHEALDWTLRHWQWRRP